jgi:DEAD/DEAH box helicase domain-containing protein
MSVEVQVTNRPPGFEEDVPSSMLELFRAVLNVPNARPFTHQAESFRLHQALSETFLVAGTAAGKTLAVAVPIFDKLRRGVIKRACFVYPTIALMEDQRRVLTELAEATEWKRNEIIGQIQGGMSRSALIAALNRPVIVATPDALYWFFRKNVKYSSLLIYGLALVDEWVLDEAHLFNGLSLRNLTHLKTRIALLASQLSRESRWHVLTATPTDDLRALTGGERIDGRSKCGDVHALFLPPVEIKRRESVLRDAVEAELADGANKVLLVLNSAAAAHRLFDKVRGDAPPPLPVELQRRFGWVMWRELRAWLISEGLANTARKVADFTRQEEPPRLRELPHDQSVTLPTETLVAGLARLLETRSRVLRTVAYETAREGQVTLGSGIEARLGQRGRIVRALWDAVKARLGTMYSAEEAKEVLALLAKEWQDTIDQNWGTELSITPPDFPELVENLIKAGLPRPLARAVTAFLAASVEVPAELAESPRPSDAVLDKRPVALAWLEWLVAEDEREGLAVRIQAALETGELEADARHIATWGETGVPVILYTGQMSKSARRGLISAFSKLEQAVLISTPAVEVGVDFAADVLITEQCDGPGYLQRFGRVGRRAGIQGKVVTLLRDESTWRVLRERVSGWPLAADDEPVADREAFSAMIVDPGEPTDPAHSLFPARQYVAESIYLDATQRLVNDQLGRIGRRLNDEMFPDERVAKLAEAMRTAEAPFAYGLRGTLPGVRLRGSAGGDAFYVLSKVSNEKLLPADSPFEAARAEIGYTQFLWQPREWDIVVDWKRTLAASQALFYRLKGDWQLATGYGIARDYLTGSSLLNRRPLRQLLEQAPESLLAMVIQASNPQLAPLQRLGDALLLYATPFAGLILAQGDIYLRRQHREGGSMEVEDRLGDPLPLSDQVWLLLVEDKEEALRRLDAADLRNREELKVEFGGEYVMLLEQMAGACFYAYERLMSNVG